MGPLASSRSADRLTASCASGPAAAYACPSSRCPTSALSASTSSGSRLASVLSQPRSRCTCEARALPAWAYGSFGWLGDFPWRAGIVRLVHHVRPGSRLRSRGSGPGLGFDAHRLAGRDRLLDGEPDRVVL